MTKTEQLILIIWTFGLTFLDLYNFEGDAQIFVIALATIIAAVFYYIIGLIMLAISNTIYLALNMLIRK